ncbi:NAD(P)-binding protein, partial [Auriscalpium vulgare]
GYIGAWTIKYLVDNGYTVLAAVRTVAQGDVLTNCFPPYSGRVSSVVVPDILKASSPFFRVPSSAEFSSSQEGAYDDVVKDVEGIIHVASPVPRSSKDPQEVIGPAVSGTTGILKSAKATRVKRAVITSSASAVCGFRTDKEYNEVHLNTENTKTSSPLAVYNTTKTRTEKAAFDYVRATQPHYDLVTLLPAFNFGPYIHQASTASPL